MTEDKKGEWQLIETAPKDGTRFLGFRDDGKPGSKYPFLCWSELTADMPAFMYETSSSQQFRTGDAYWASPAAVNSVVHPTHWMPLPTPPVESRP